MNHKSIVLFIFTYTIFTSVCCTQTIIKPESEALLDLRHIIQMNIDSTNDRLDRMINSQIENELTPDATDIYRRKVNKNRIDINLAFRDAYRVSHEEGWTQVEYDHWTEGFISDSVSKKTRILRNLGIDLNELPVTSKYQLTAEYEDTTHNFSLKFPENWTVGFDSSGNIFQGYGILDTTTKSSNLEGIFSVISSSLTSDHNNERDVESQIENLRKEIQKFDLQEQYSIDIDKTPGYFISFTGEIKGVTMHIFQICIIQTRKRYVFSGNIIGSSKDSMDFREIFLEIARTFKYLKR